MDPLTIAIVVLFGGSPILVALVYIIDVVYNIKSILGAPREQSKPTARVPTA